MWGDGTGGNADDRLQAAARSHPRCYTRVPLRRHAPAGGWCPERSEHRAAQDLYVGHRWRFGHPDEITSAQITQAIEAQLSARGLTKTDGTSDLELQDWVEVQPERLSIGNGSNMGMGVGGGLRSAPTTSPATETLHLNVYDAATKQLVWEAAATRPLDGNTKPEKRQKNIDKTVAKLLKKYPAVVK